MLVRLGLGVKEAGSGTGRTRLWKRAIDNEARLPIELRPLMVPRQEIERESGAGLDVLA